jgi:hypothetical protein
MQIIIQRLDRGLISLGLVAAKTNPLSRKSLGNPWRRLSRMQKPVPIVPRACPESYRRVQSLRFVQSLAAVQSSRFKSSRKEPSRHRVATIDKQHKTDQTPAAWQSIAPVAIPDFLEAVWLFSR